jgi:hypothetical protein
LLLRGAHGFAILMASVRGFARDSRRALETLLAATPVTYSSFLRPRRWFDAWNRAWWLLFVFCLLVVGVLDVVLLELGHSYFSGGFNGVYVRDLPLVAGFALASVAQDAWLILGLWGLLVPLSARLRLGALQTLGLAGLFTLAVPLFVDFLRYQLHHVLGDLSGLGVLWELAGSDLPSAVVEAAAYVSPLSIPALCLSVALFAVLATTSRLERRVCAESFAAPGGASLWALGLLLGLVGILVLRAPGASAERIQFGLLRKPSGLVLARLGEWITDVDRDGFGLFSALRDPDPFDSSIYPWAPDLPGNGIDENGMGGDHPVGFEPLRAIERASLRPSSRRDVLLIFLESFRADLIARRFQGREVTPFLNRLAREGAHSERAYVHTPSTVASRGQLFAGRLVARAGESTLIDDFKSRDYFVAHFSGQNDAYGNSEALLGVERADLFYDARQDQERRTSRSTSPVGLQVSWKVLIGRVLSFLEPHDPERPLFLYVNIVDTHFPYHHREMERLLDIEPLVQAEIRADRAERVWETYLNAAANVDRAVEELVTAWWSRRGRDGVILVTADHGQSLYDDEGFLGHGRSLRSPQTRVPFILWGLGGEWPEPLGLADVRGLLARHLSGPEGVASSPARFVRDPGRFLFGYGPRIDAPRLLGLRSLERTLLYDLENDRLQLLGADGERLELAPALQRSMFESLIWNWEALRLPTASGSAS